MAYQIAFSKQVSSSSASASRQPLTSHHSRSPRQTTATRRSPGSYRPSEPYQPSASHCLKSASRQPSSKGEASRHRSPKQDRTPQPFDTENKGAWCSEGEHLECAFVRDIAPRLGIDLRVNPAKSRNPYAIDLIDYDHNRLADLKSPRTPFFTAHLISSALDPRFTVTFNVKDYRRYAKLYPDCDIYLHVRWDQLVYGDIRIEPLEGVWRAAFSDMRSLIENGEIPCHAYKRRHSDPHNARDSYLFDLRNPVFERLL